MFIWSLWEIRGPRNHADHLSKQREVFFCRLSFFFHELDCIVTVVTLAYFSFLVRSKLDVLKCSEPPASKLVLNPSRFLFGVVTVGTPPSKPRGTHITVTCGTHCHPGHPHPDLPIKHTWHAFPDYLKEDQTTLINISSGRLTQYIRMINIFHPDTMVQIID